MQVRTASGGGADFAAGIAQAVYYPLFPEDDHRVKERRRNGLADGLLEI